MTYNPRDHFLKLKARKAGDAPVDYLPVAERVRWFREEHPDGDMETTVVELSDTRAVMLARVSIPNGGSASTIGSETKIAFADYIEKAATVALGRALAILGYGVGFTDEFEERRQEADKRDYAMPAAEPAPPAPLESRPGWPKPKTPAPAPEPDAPKEMPSGFVERFRKRVVEREEMNAPELSDAERAPRVEKARASLLAVDAADTAKLQRALKTLTTRSTVGDLTTAQLRVVEAVIREGRAAELVAVGG